MKAELDEELSRFGLDKAALGWLGRAWTLIEPHLDRILDAFYARVGADPSALGFFHDDSRIAAARQAQKTHWSLLLSGNFGDEYAASTERIGRTHARIKLPLDVYMSAYAGASSGILRILVAKRGRSMLPAASRGVGDMVAAVNRAFAFDIARVTSITFAVWNEELERAFHHLEGAIRQLEAGNLRHQIPSPRDSDFPERYDGLRLQMNKAAARLDRTLAGVDSHLSAVIGQSERVSDMADDLSTRTNSQAASLEETAAAMQEITETVASAATMTESAREVTGEAQRELEEASRAVAAASDAMHEIQASSQKISSITQMIEDIAFQTNLLALNAGVEAARAGTAGAGFAVVATEVRNLAVNAGTAAKEIRQLIATSSSQVESGVDLVGRTGQHLRGLVRSFTQVDDLSRHIAKAAQEQSHGIREINVSISQMDTITQKNAAMVDDTQHQVSRMKQSLSEVTGLLGQFRFNALTAPADNEPEYFLRAG
ncbi:globin-coupled sensor protein [Pararhodobacter marinus]|uniref:globin-coupled sensor protein n=1 Tax=Pararhodobacter marinus TaxID=2184063 RepID=UPI0035160B30